MKKAMEPGNRIRGRGKTGHHGVHVIEHAEMDLKHE
jgi:hypothetical protein